MYRIVRASILYYEAHMKASTVRYELVKPMLLLIDSSKFNEAKEKMTNEYIGLCDIVSEMRKLYLTGEGMFHHFGMLLGELQTLGFDVDGMRSFNRTDADTLKDQIDLMLQFLAYRYPFDEYDNKIGVHDPATNKFIFSQP